MTIEDALQRLRSANPLPGIEHVDPDELELFLADFDRRSLMRTTDAPRHETAAEPPPRRTLRPAWVAGLALVVVLVAVGGAALWLRDGDETPAATQPPPTTAPVDEVIPAAVGGLTWSRTADLPSDALFAVTATPDGFLAASPAEAGGVDFWTSVDGSSWELLVSDQLSETQAPTVEELRILRDEVDPDRLFIGR